MNDTHDVIVVGHGAAGAAAALTAAEQGATVLVLERFASGGASARSGGTLYLGGGTSTQRGLGFEDDPEQLARYLAAETRGAVSAAVLKEFCADSVATHDWLVSLGLDFSGRFFGHKTTHPPDGHALYWSGNEPQRADVAVPAPRGHVPATEGMAGRVVFEALARAGEAHGVQVRERCRVTSLLTDDRGAVIGVEGLAVPRKPALEAAHRALFGLGMVSRSAVPLLDAFERRVGRPFTARARHAVVLAAGGFVFDAGLIATHAPAYARCMPLGTPGDDGAALRLGQSVGAATDRLHECAAWRFLYPPEAFVSGVLVNARGERFADESLYGATICRHVSEQPGGQAWLIIDAATARRARAQLGQEERIRDYPLGKLLAGELNALLFRQYSTYLNLHWNRHRSGTLVDLARRCGLPPGALERTMADHDGRLARGEPDAFGKAERYRAPLVEPPFRAINCDLDNPLFLGPCITLGGLRTDPLTARVLREDGSPIPGLLAAGRSAAGLCAGGYVSGFSLADCLFSGRRAGRTALIER